MKTLQSTKNGNVFNIFSSRDTSIADIYMLVGIQMFKFNGKK